MTTSFVTFPCAECGGAVRMLPARGETREFRRGVHVAIPPEVLIPACEKCGETYFSEADSERVDAAVRGAYLDEQRAVYARCVGELRRAHGLTLGDIEELCGVTPTYFSHVMKGRRVASLTLTRLLEALVACPAEVARHRAEAAAREQPARESLRGVIVAVPTRPGWAASTIARSARAKRRPGRSKASGTATLRVAA